MNINTVLLFTCSVLLFGGCATTSNQAYSDRNRILVLGEVELREWTPWQFVSWKCRNYSDGGKTLVEVGRAIYPKIYKSSYKYQNLSAEEKEKLYEISKTIGFVLYDGTDIGDLTKYRREGLTQSWEWGESGSTYTFVMKADGTGLYYDFGTAENGAKNKANVTFKCSK